MWNRNSQVQERVMGASCAQVREDNATSQRRAKKLLTSPAHSALPVCSRSGSSLENPEKQGRNSPNPPGEEVGVQVRSPNLSAAPWVWILALPPTSCVILYKSLTILDCLNCSYLLGLFHRFDELMCKGVRTILGTCTLFFQQNLLPASTG